MNHSVLSPVTDEAAGIAHIWWIFFAVCVVVYFLVFTLVALAAWKHRASGEEPPPLARLTVAGSDLPLHRVLIWATGATVLILLGLLGADLWVQRGIGPLGDHPLTIELTGHQWWWDARYDSDHPAEIFETANELHVPVGRPIRLLLSSNDVIHSFWVPQLHGKKDLVPGHPATLSFLIRQAGRYEGQCAEFCGLQHAHMGIVIIAEDPPRYAAWAKAQRAEASQPADARLAKGRTIFERGTCASCHTVQGTLAHSRFGPGLTHFASNEGIGAGTISNTREHLAAWISNPDALKPGVHMPSNHFAPDDFNALLDYMETLK